MFQKKQVIKADEMIVEKNDFGLLVENFVQTNLRHSSFSVEWFDGTLRRWWPTLEEYYRRHIISAIEVTIALDEPPRYGRQEMEPAQKSMWVKLVKDLRSPRSEFTIDYHCHKCKAKDLKLWRGVHGAKDKNNHGLLCATCLVPGQEVDASGKLQDKDIGIKTDQVNGWLPAVPVDNTYWGYSSVPSQDVEWWIALPTYKKDP
jgi:hypothetical protein